MLGYTGPSRSRQSRLMSAPGSPSTPPTAAVRPARLLPFAAIMLVSVMVIGIGWYRGVSPDAALERHATIDAFVAEHWVVALAAFAAIYVAVVALSLPGAALLTICGGAMFGGLAAGSAA